MKAKLLILSFLFLTARAWAESDRFGNWRQEVPRSSYTETADKDVFIATVTELNTLFATMTPTAGGDLVLRSVIFSGLVASTIAFYDDSQFNQFTTTRTKLIYTPQAGSGGAPVQIFTDVYFSSGILYNKIGLAPVQINWDWLTNRKSGDSRK